MTAITESPVFVLFNPAARNAASKDLPITLYESGVFAGSALHLCRVAADARTRSSELHVVGDVPVLTFVKAEYTIEVCLSCIGPCFAIHVSVCAVG
jgi:hypothetical protein